MSKLKIEITKFTMVGLVNTAITFVIFYFLLREINLNYNVALTITWIYAVFFTYLLNYLWVFKPEQKLQFKERFVKYLLSYLLSFSLNIFSLNYIVEHFGIDPLYAQTILVPFIVAFNFISSKFWSLSTKVVR